RGGTPSEVIHRSTTSGGATASGEKTIALGLATLAKSQRGEEGGKIEVLKNAVKRRSIARAASARVTWVTRICLRRARLRPLPRDERGDGTSRMRPPCGGGVSRPPTAGLARPRGWRRSASR